MVEESLPGKFCSIAERKNDASAGVFAPNRAGNPTRFPGELEAAVVIG